MITTDRNQYLGAHVTPTVRQGLRDEANKRGISVSALVFQLLFERLKELGHNVGAETK